MFGLLSSAVRNHRSDSHEFHLTLFPPMTVAACSVQTNRFLAFDIALLAYPSCNGHDLKENCKAGEY